MGNLVIMALAMAIVNAAAKPQIASSAPPKPSNMPKLGGSPVPFGPAPTGCNAYEIVIGELWYSIIKIMSNNYQLVELASRVRLALASLSNVIEFTKNSILTYIAKLLVTL
jgi:hypothetical protein